MWRRRDLQPVKKQSLGKLPERICAYCEFPITAWTNVRVGKYFVGIHPDCAALWTRENKPDRNPNGRRMDGDIE